MTHDPFSARQVVSTPLGERVVYRIDALKDALRDRGQQDDELIQMRFDRLMQPRPDRRGPDPRRDREKDRDRNSDSERDRDRQRPRD